MGMGKSRRCTEENTPADRQTLEVKEKESEERQEVHEVQGAGLGSRETGRSRSQPLPAPQFRVSSEMKEREKNVGKSAS